jgi:8-oxo-dGTP pyrophosphatase MutT (NUDIX family)
VDVARIISVVATGRPPRRVTGEPDATRDAAVLVPVFEQDGEAWLLLTRRSQHLRNHRGEVSFPGGRKDPGESSVEAALREAQEEIGLDPATVEVIGELDHLTTVVSGAAIVPVVGVLPARPVDLVPSPDEVELVLMVPFSDLLHPATHHSEIWPILGAERDIHFFELPGDTIWGATARILYGLITRLLDLETV